MARRAAGAEIGVLVIAMIFIFMINMKGIIQRQVAVATERKLAHGGEVFLQPRETSWHGYAAC